jgi:hypothetical protein
MAFIYTGTVPNRTVVSFAEYSDVVNADQRLFEANEGLTDTVIEDFLVRSTERILTLIRATSWWNDLYMKSGNGTTYTRKVDLPAVNPNLILARQNDFTELCVMYALWNYVLPKIADFSKEDNAERAKIGFYQGKYQFLFDELINAGDWYDLNADGQVESIEKLEGDNSLKRIR